MDYSQLLFQQAKGLIEKDLQSNIQYIPPIKASDKEELMRLLAIIKNHNANKEHKERLQQLCDQYCIILYNNNGFINPVMYGNKEDYEQRKEYNKATIY